MNVLERIIAYKIEEVARAKRALGLSALSARAMATPAPRGFIAAIDRRRDRPALIAEVKKASPSKGLIRADFDPSAIASAYCRAGADCLSVLTDGPSFQGSPDDLVAVRASVAAPILRKDFMIDAYQIAEARAWGADCILLIMASLDDARARDLAAAAREFALDILWETHDETEVERALSLGALLVGVNNRDLRSFTTDLTTTERLARLLPPGVLLVSESGITNSGDVRRLAASGARAVLVGETLMRADDIEAATRALLTA